MGIFSGRSAPPGLRPASRPRGTQHQRLWRRTLRLIARHRRFSASVFLAAAAAVAVAQLTPAPPQTVQVLTAAHELAAGSKLDGDQLTLTKVPAKEVSAHSFTSGQVPANAQLAVPMRRGQVLVDTLLAGQTLLAGAPPGNVAVPIRLADPATATLIHPGQSVRIIGSGEDPTGQSTEGKVLAEQATVLWVQKPGDSGTPFGASSSSADGLIVVSAGTDDAASLAAANGKSRISVVLLDSP